METINNRAFRLSWISLASALILLLSPFIVSAHGVDIGAVPISAVEVIALYDSGKPMAGGQVAIYAPDEPLEPWLTGTCDEEGSFIFVPDYSRPGLWEIQVRLAGHGDLIRLEVTAAEEAVVDGSGGLSFLQKIVMALVVAWGAIGTAFYFSRRSS
ncbi:MAG: carboxypeptidase regulatory-like domain-containing protein [Firmicutes bacterium]|nr:carboxypeptidase regulatory-like domain-containing protein [Bacillota bacterium]